MSKIDALVKELRDGLEGVTPGPWQSNGEFSSYCIYGPKFDVCELGSYQPKTQAEANRYAANARHLTLCSPENIAALLDRIEALTAENAALKTERDAAITESDKVCDSYAAENQRLSDRIEALEKAMTEIEWKSIDKDNMEFRAVINCYRMDMIRATLKGGAK